MRIFVALDIPDEVREAIGALIAKLRPTCRAARWVRTEGAHVTLKFIGEVPTEKIDSIKAALATILLANPIDMTFRSVGFFPNEKRPRIFWAGTDANADLAALASSVETALEPVGVVREKHAFSPHITLARFDSPHGLDGLRKAVAAFGPLEFGRTIAREFHLYQSVLKPGGAEYTCLATFGFVGSELR